jgi:mono/diheme cytochrome c family protein
MNEEEKRSYLAEYNEKKKKGLPFFPDILFKDAVISLFIFLALVALAYFVGAPLEERANPADTSYTPRPEWYFLFLFQLLKIFPPNLEVIGVVIIPTLAILLLFVLPFIDSSRFRSPLRRPVVTGVTALGVIGIIYLTVMAVRESPPPAATAVGDQTAALYTSNCAGCHGPSIEVPVGANLHEIIAQGKHDEGMPAWNSDLTTNEIDALAGFILSPEGSQLFTNNCAQCHEAPDLVAGDPLQLRDALEQGKDFQPHADVDIPDWSSALAGQEKVALLNFLSAPDGERLFAINCAPCHGVAPPFSGEREQLVQIISQGGLHLEMPPWREKLSDSEIDTLARYVVNPASVPEGASAFQTYCSQCHGERIPVASDVETARQIIATGGAHQTMPVWGQVLTPEQLNALVDYSLSAASGTPLEVGQEIFSQNCSGCHGEFGEGGLNPTRPDDIIAPISSAEYLRTRDDATLHSIISQGQPNFGMSPFGTANGGPLDDEEIDAVVAYIRSWEANPPVELPPEINVETLSLDGAEIYAQVCAQCHGTKGEGLVGPALSDPEFQDSNTDQQIFDTINQGHDATAMIGWGEILNAEQIQQLVEFLRQLEPITPTAEPGPGPTPTPSVPSFSDDVFPILDENCVMCHGSSGGWDASSYEAVMTTGDNAPVVIPGDALNSLLAEKLLGTQSEGTVMPPRGKLPDDEIQVILDWIAGGAPDN